MMAELLAFMPRGLSRKEAAAYCGLPPATFDARVADGVLPGPAFLGRTRIWDRQALDRSMDLLSGIAPQREQFEEQALRAIRGEAAPTRKTIGAPLPPPTFEEEVVYFIEAPSVRLIKIGWSGRMYLRFAALRAGSPVELIFLGYVKGGAELEAELHARFAAERQHGEWFADSPVLRSFVSKFLSQHGIRPDG